MNNGDERGETAGRVGEGLVRKRAGYFSYFHYTCKVSDCDLLTEFTASTWLIK